MNNYFPDVEDSFTPIRELSLRRQVDFIEDKIKELSLDHIYLYCANDMNKFVCSLLQRNRKVDFIFDQNALNLDQNTYSSKLSVFDKTLVLDNSCIVIASNNYCIEIYEYVKNQIIANNVHYFFVQDVFFQDCDAELKHKLASMKDKDYFHICLKSDITPVPFMSDKAISDRKSYKQLVVTQGFCHSGSGAILDILSELDNSTVFGYFDKISPLSKNIQNAEVDFLRDFGGFFWLEYAFNGRINQYAGDMMLIFLGMCESLCSKYNSAPYDSNFYRNIKEFIFEISDSWRKHEFPMIGVTDFKNNFEQIKYTDFEYPFSRFHCNNRKLYVAKKLSLQEYRNIAKNYLSKILLNIKSEELLVLDQFLADGTADFEKYDSYLDNYKMIAVVRDPRDVFCEAIRDNIYYIPHDKVEFVEFYKRAGIERYKDSKNVLVLRFEDLIKNYDATLERLLDFLKIDKCHHINTKMFFNPEISKKNVGIYLNFNDTDSIHYIESNLKSYCYYN